MLARKAVLVVLNDIIGATLGYIALYLILREFGAFQYGILAFGLGFVRLYGLLTNLGFNRSH
ncbi:MAG TPA: teichoic acid transporter, partial [Thermoplasmata archaeon]|nr:teichoic acid transporter [Thermoplasmata archaeon]